MNVVVLLASLWTGFLNPPQESKPWCYYWWINGHVDRETITADLESMRDLGFGGILLFDSRGYFDNEDHVVNPKAEIDWGSSLWYDYVEFTIRECARLGLEFTMNASASGGWLNGFVDGKEYQVDVLKREEVIAHLDRVIGPIIRRVPGLIGQGKTFTHIYSVSYEGGVKAGGTWSQVKDSFYATMREWAHAHGFKVYSESGGPWGQWSADVKLDCSQLDMLAHNDVPQGEFWLLQEYAYGDPATVRHANANGRFFQRGVVLSARREGRNVISMESFTHMMRHYSADPALLKPLGDMAFADGANRIVWHTFTCSPKKFGIPGAEYFAGSHINRNVTWQKDAAPFVKYLGRCSHLLRQGVYVDDGEFADVRKDYYDYDEARYRRERNPQFTTTHRRTGDVDIFFVAGEGRGAVELNCDVCGRAVEAWDAVTGTRQPIDCDPSGRGKPKVDLDLPIGGSCFVVVGEGGAEKRCRTASCREVPVSGPWKVSFAYHPGITATPPKPVEFSEFVDWTTRDDLKHFAGTAAYRTALDLKTEVGERCVIALGHVPSGTVRVLVDGIDCGVAWCEPWKVDVTRAVCASSERSHCIELRYTNNWYNRLVGDCLVPESERVTKSTLRYWTVPRKKTSGYWALRPTIWSGPSSYDKLQSSGLLGPVRLEIESMEGLDPSTCGR